MLLCSMFVILTNIGNGLHILTKMYVMLTFENAKSGSDSVKPQLYCYNIIYLALTDTYVYHSIQ